MKVSINWLNELVDLKLPWDEVLALIPLRTIGIKEESHDFIELDMKGYNRADLLSMRGVAYEIAAITDSEVTFTEPDPGSFAWADKNLPEVSVSVEDPNLAPFYCIAKISGLKVESSPTEWVKKLEDSGIRSINNVADITNLVMLEYGQPSHAFDNADIADETLIVRTAREGETLTTLDGKTRKLTRADLLITDPIKAVGLAGVMGGKDSEVKENTSSILLEVAVFDPISIRKTAQTHNLPSEASKRFQHGLTKVRALQALDALLKMYEGIGGTIEAISITDNLKEETKKITLNKDRVNSLIGIDIKADDISSYLEKLNFRLTKTSDSWEVEVPYFRLDTEIEEDLIEEVARMYGYERIPAKPLEGDLPEKINQEIFELIYKIKTGLVKAGLTEVQTYSFYSTKTINDLQLTVSDLVKVANPISSETEYLKTHLWPNLVETIAKNKKQGFEDIAVFEIGKTYQLTKSGEIQEEYKLSVALMNGTDNPTQELYQILTGISELKENVKLGEPIGESDGRFHPVRYHYLTDRENPIGKIGEVHPRVTDKFGIGKRVAILEVLLAPLL